MSGETDPAATPGGVRVGRPGRRRDRHGRGLRGMLAPPLVPIAHSRADAFDAMVLHAVDHLQLQLGDQLAEVEFAVEDVPELSEAVDEDMLDDNGVPLSRLYRTGLAGISAPVIVLYRRPLESRAVRGEDLADLVHDVVVEQVARLLGRSADEIDPPATD